MKLKMRLVSLFAATLLLALPARAGLIGDTITATGYGLNPSSATIGSGIEFSAQSGGLYFDFGDSTLTLTTTVLFGWSGFGTFTFSGFDSTITGLNVVGSSGTWYGGTLNNYSFTASSITLDMNSGGQWPGPPVPLVFNIQTQQTNSVPDGGATVALFGGALLGLAALRRRWVG